MNSLKLFNAGNINIEYSISKSIYNPNDKVLLTISSDLSNSNHSIKKFECGPVKATTIKGK